MSANSFSSIFWRLLWNQNRPFYCLTVSYTKSQVPILFKIHFIIFFQQHSVVILSMSWGKFHPFPLLVLHFSDKLRHDAWLGTTSNSTEHSNKNIILPSTTGFSKPLLTLKCVVFCYLILYFFFFTINHPLTFALRRGILWIFFFLLALALNVRSQHKQHWGSSSAANAPICCTTMRESH